MQPALPELNKAAASRRTMIMMIEELGMPFARDHVDVTPEILAESKRKLSLIENMIAGHA